MTNEIQTSVVIVGGGGCGLTLSSFLSNYGIEHVLLERHTGTSILPKAHYLNQRTMEILRHHDMVKEVLEKTCPPRHMSQVAWQTSLGGSGPLDRKLISKFECFGGSDGSEYAESYKLDNPHLQYKMSKKLTIDTDAMRRSAPETFRYSDWNLYLKTSQKRETLGKSSSGINC